MTERSINNGLFVLSMQSTDGNELGISADGVYRRAEAGSGIPLRIYDALETLDRSGFEATMLGGKFPGLTLDSMLVLVMKKLPEGELGGLTIEEQERVLYVFEKRTEMFTQEYTLQTGYKTEMNISFTTATLQDYLEISDIREVKFKMSDLTEKGDGNEREGGRILSESIADHFADASGLIQFRENLQELPNIDSHDHLNSDGTLSLFGLNRFTIQGIGEKGGYSVYLMRNTVVEDSVYGDKQFESMIAYVEKQMKRENGVECEIQTVSLQDREELIRLMSHSVTKSSPHTEYHLALYELPKAIESAEELTSIGWLEEEIGRDLFDGRTMVSHLEVIKNTFEQLMLVIGEKTAIKLLGHKDDIQFKNSVISEDGESGTDIIENPEDAHVRILNKAFEIKGSRNFKVNEDEPIVVGDYDGVRIGILYSWFFDLTEDSNGFLLAKYLLDASREFRKDLEEHNILMLKSYEDYTEEEFKVKMAVNRKYPPFTNGRANYVYESDFEQSFKDGWLRTLSESNFIPHNERLHRVVLEMLVGGNSNQRIVTYQKKDLQSIFSYFDEETTRILQDDGEGVGLGLRYTGELLSFTNSFYTYLAISKHLLNRFERSNLSLPEFLAARSKDTIPDRIGITLRNLYMQAEEEGVSYHGGTLREAVMSNDILDDVEQMTKSEAADMASVFTQLRTISPSFLYSYRDTGNFMKGKRIRMSVPYEYKENLEDSLRDFMNLEGVGGIMNQLGIDGSDIVPETTTMIVETSLVASELYVRYNTEGGTISKHIMGDLPFHKNKGATEEELDIIKSFARYTVRVEEGEVVGYVEVDDTLDITTIEFVMNVLKNLSNQAEYMTSETKRDVTFEVDALSIELDIDDKELRQQAKDFLVK